jgi:CspA family cold shock protein
VQSAARGTYTRKATGTSVAPGVGIGYAAGGTIESATVIASPPPITAPRAERITNMATGTIKTLRGDKGFGFIRVDGSDDDSDVFFHRTAVASDGFDALEQGQRVSFEVQPDPRDPRRSRAENVTLVD